MTFSRPVGSHVATSVGKFMQHGIFSYPLSSKLVEKFITTKFYELQPEYMGESLIKVTVCNVIINLLEQMLVSFLSAYGHIKDISPLQANSGTANSDFTFLISLKWEGFSAILDISFGNQLMMVVVEGRCPHCWHCRQPSHFTRNCSQKTREG